MDCRNPRMMCYRCGEQGHVALNCVSRAEMRSCFTCGAKGHLSHECAQISNNRSGYGGGGQRSAAPLRGGGRNFGFSPPNRNPNDLRLATRPAGEPGRFGREVDEVPRTILVVSDVLLNLLLVQDLSAGQLTRELHQLKLTH